MLANPPTDNFFSCDQAAYKKSFGWKFGSKTRPKNAKKTSEFYWKSMICKMFGSAKKVRKFGQKFATHASLYKRSGL